MFSGEAATQVSSLEREGGGFQPDHLLPPAHTPSAETARSRCTGTWGQYSISAPSKENNADYIH